MKNKCKFLLLISLLLIFSCSSKDDISDFEYGSNLYKNGQIENKSTKYDFSGFKEDSHSMLKNYFDYIYFEGDTLCFSFEFPHEFKKKDVVVFFDFPDKKISVRAERIEVNKTRIYGFSLIGSLLEYYYYDKLHDNYNSSDLKKKYDCVLRIELNERGKIHYFEKNISFKIK